MAFSLFLLLVLSSCGKSEEEATNSAPLLTKVTAKTVEESMHLPVTVSYPGVVSPEQDVKVTASAVGTATGVTVNLGDKVRAGQILMQIDDSNGGGAGSFNATQLAQSQLAVDQARTSLELSKKSYASLEASIQKDLEQSKASADQAGRNVQLTGTTNEENIKAAELAYESAQLSVEQAQNALENRTILAAQAEEDTKTNAFTTVTTYASSASSIIDNINTLTGFDDNKNVDVPYKQNLGALDSSTKITAEIAYDQAVRAHDDYKNFICSEASSCLTKTADFLLTTKKAIDATVSLFEKTTSGANLPETSATATSLSSIKSTATGYQSQINAAITAINAAKQNLLNTTLNNKNTLDQLQKSLDLAKKQEASASQNLKNIRAQIASQKDQVGTNASVSQTSYEALQFKLQSQLDSARTQVAQAEIAYQNAQLALQNFSNSRTITAPIDGTITTKEVAVGDAVNIGQTLFTVSKTGNVKVEVYVDEMHHALIKQGDVAKVKNSNNQEFSATVSRIAPQADPVTKRFLIELLPRSGQSGFPLAGAVVDAALQIIYQPITENDFFVPLSSVTIGQNESSIFTLEKNTVKRATVTIVKVFGEYAEIAAEIPKETQIVFDGARMVSEGEEVEVMNNNQ